MHLKPQSSKLKPHLGLIAVLVLAGLLRLIPLWVVSANGGNPLIGDEGNYVEAALSLAGGGGIPDRWLWIRPPGYIAFAAAIFRLAANSLVALQLAQIAVSLLTIIATYALVLVAFSPAPQPGEAASTPKSKIQNPKSVALVAALILAVQPSLILSTGLFLTETLFLLLITGLVGALIVYLRATEPRPALVAAVAAGACAGAALLTRASLIPLLLLAVVALGWHPNLPRKLRAGAVAAFVGCVIVLLVPWTVRNALHYGRFLPLDTVGYYVIWYDNTDLTPAEVRQALNDVPNPADRGNVALREAITWAVQHPDRFLTRSAQRMIDSLAPDEFTQLGYPVRDKYPGRDALERDSFAFVAWWGWVLLFGGALAGWLLAPRNPLWWLAAGVVAVYVLTGALTHNEFRYRYQLFSLLAIYAALAAGRAWEALRARRWSSRAVLPAAVFLIWIIATLPTFWPGFARAVWAETAISAARDARATGPLAQAALLYETAAQNARTNGAIRREWGLVQQAQGDRQAAGATWTDGLTQEPGDWRTRALLVDLWRQEGQTKRAVSLAREVPPVFNGVMLGWAWSNLTATPPLTLTAGWDDLGDVAGFQIGEDDPQAGSFRWAGPETTARIRLAGGQSAGARVTLLMRALPQGTDAPRPVQVSSGGTTLATFDIGPGWTTYTLDLPATLTAGNPAVVLIFTAPVQPASATDPRLLSFALARATITPP
jgi:4-amino-4-deoxy-L-arabinose transferase-like glycosyltransferase